MTNGSAEQALITEESMSRARLREILERAYLKTSLDEDGDILVQIQDVRLVLILNKDNSTLKALAVFRLSHQRPHHEVLETINTLNKQIITAQISVDFDVGLILIYAYHRVEGGVTERNLMMFLNHAAQIARVVGGHLVTENLAA